MHVDLYKPMLVAMLVVLAGCTWKGGADNGPAETGEVWSIRPVSMRVYPSTRFIESEGRTMLDTRIELLDEAGDTTKGVGRFRFDLLSTDGPRGGDSGTRLYSWDVPMLTLEQNKAHWDPVTRAYLCRLSIDEPEVAKEAVRLRAILNTAGGDRLEAEAVLREGDRAAAH